MRYYLKNRIGRFSNHPISPSPHLPTQMFNLTKMNVFCAFILIGILLLVARFVKQQVKLLQDLYIPESIIAGTLALFLGREVLGAGVAPDSYLAGGLFQTVNNIWQQTPGVFINIVFAALFLGQTIPKPREIWRKTAPQLAFSYCLAWGQYVVGILLTMLVLVPFFHLAPVAGTLIEIAFEGGHGTAAGMADTLSKLNFPEGGDLGLGLATVGIISGMVIGTILANWGRSQGYLAIEGEKGFEVRGLEFKGEEEGKVLLIDPLSLNFGLTGLAVAIAWLMLQGFAELEALTWGRIGLELVAAIPLFPFALMGGIIVQLFLSRFGWENLVSRELQQRIAGVALDVVVVTAIASINLTLLGSNLAPFLLLSVTGILWNVFAFLYLAPRLLPNYWFPRGMADLGQSMGVTATGILLLRMVDPDNRSGAFESFAYKQLFFEPIMGGGLFTAIAPTLIYQFGLLTVLLLTVALFAFCLIFGMINYNRR